MKTKTMNQEERIKKSQRFFKSFTLYFYDLVVFNFITQYAWKCSFPILINHYKKWITANHLEVGVGTGYLLDNCNQLSSHSRLALMDLNQNCLDKTLHRLSRYNPEVYIQDILKPISVNNQKFNSVGINYVMHCVPGDFSEKGIAFKNLKLLLNDGGVLFGSSLIYKGNCFAKFLMKGLNLIGLFNNQNDTLETLYKSLKVNFNHVEIEMVGSAALFSARD